MIEKILVGNKCDMNHKRQVNFIDGQVKNKTDESKLNK